MIENSPKTVTTTENVSDDTMLTATSVLFCDITGFVGTIRGGSIRMFLEVWSVGKGEFFGSLFGNMSDDYTVVQVDGATPKRCFSKGP